MTILNAVEQIKDVFPRLGYNQILLMLDDAQKEFVSETKYLTEEGGLSDISNNTAWSLPDDFLRMYDISFYDSNNKPLSMANLGMDYEVEFNKIFLKSTTSTVLTSVPSSVSSGFLHYFKKPTTLALSSGAIPTGSFDVDDRYDNYIVDRVLQRCFARYPIDVMTSGGISKILNFNAASYHEKQYEKGIKKAKREEQEPIGEAVNYDHAGRFGLPQRTYTSGGSVSLNTLQALSALWSNYVRIGINDSVATVLSPKVGYGTISASVSGSAVTIESTAEFENDTWIDASNKNYSVTSFSSSEIVLTFADITGDFEIEIGDKYAT